MALGPIANVSVLHTGVSGIQRGIQGASQAANTIAGVGTNSQDATADITNAAVNLKQNENLVQASARVVKAAHGMIGTLLDVTA